MKDVLFFFALCLFGLTAKPILAGHVQVFRDTFDGGNGGVPIGQTFSGVNATFSSNALVNSSPNGEEFLGSNDPCLCGIGAEVRESTSFVSLELSGLPTHSSIHIQFETFFIRQWDGDGHYGAGPDFFRFQAGQDVLVNNTFSNWFEAEKFGIKKQYQSYPVANSRDGTGAVRKNTLGYKIPNPEKGGALDNQDSTYFFDFKVPHTASSVKFTWETYGAGINPIDDESFGIDNIFVAVEEAFPSLSTSASPFTSFGSVLIGQSAPASQVLIRNSGDLGSVLTGFSSVVSGAEFSVNTSSFALGLNQSVARNVNYHPQNRGQDVGTIRVNSNAGFQDIDFTGRGVAPLGIVGSIDAGKTRVGASSTASVFVENTGNGNDAGAVLGTLGGLSGEINNLFFSVPSQAGTFVGEGSAGTQQLRENESQRSFDFDFVPSERGQQFSTLEVTLFNGSGLNNGFGVVPITVSGEALSPIFDSNYGRGGVIELREVDFFTEYITSLEVQNVTPDIGSVELVGLTILEIRIEGQGAEFLDVEFNPLPFLSSERSLVDLQLNRNARPGASINAQLIVLTDEGAPLGEVGQEFVFQLNGSVSIPEPSTIILLFGTVSLVTCMRLANSIH